MKITTRSRRGIRVALVVAAGCVAVLAEAAPVQLVEQAPVKIRQVDKAVWMVDFGRVAFGNVRLLPPAGAGGEVTVHFGEALDQGRVNRKPAGTVRYSQVAVGLGGGQRVLAAPPVDKRNTEAQTDKHPPAILTPKEWGVVTPFRWVEIEGWPGELKPEHVVRQAAFASTWDDEAAAFRSSDEMLDKVWELCRYSIKATTFAGVYVDGDRERIPYEADAYLNQLSHYATDRDIRMARDTFDHLMKHPTWPTEWSFHMIFMAHADWMHTGDLKWLAQRYESLKPKLLAGRAREDGLLVSNAAQVKRDDIVDWPVGERDGFVHKPVNTVVNAFYIHSLVLMSRMALNLGRDAEAEDYLARAKSARAAFQQKLFDPARGVYRDGEGTDHASLHANLFPLAFGIVPEEHRAGVAKWLAERGMRCSVYAAQYLLEGLFESGQAARALELMLAPGDRSWRHMVESGTTITWEAWDQKYKPNQDWNHAWGAAPANLLPRYVLGVQAAEPGWKKAVVSPHPGTLARAEGKVPTPRGPVAVKWRNEGGFRLELALPDGMTARVEVPAAQASREVLVDGKVAPAEREGDRWVLRGEVSGKAVIEVR